MNQTDANKSNTASDAEVIDFVNRNWETFAQFAYQCYVYHGRGAMIINEDDALNGNLQYHFRDVEGAEVGTQVREYDPLNEVVFLAQRRSGEQYCLRISTPPGRLTPPTACEEVFRNAHGPLDFEWLMNNHRSELDQQGADEHRAETRLGIKRAIQDFLRALHLNLEAFLATGLELDELCPLAGVGESCADRLVLLSVLKDGIVRIDDSDSKRRWKPGPKWSKLEEILLAQDEKEAPQPWTTTGFNEIRL
jgi:hypothetical protein